MSSAPGPSVERPTPTVSIALATYNGERFLREQLDSFQAQERLPDELIVSDDGSSDGTKRLVQEFAGRAPFPVRLIANAHEQGIPGNFQSAIEACSGDLVFLSDQDDVWLPNHVSAMVEEFRRDPALAVVVSDSECVDEELKSLGFTIFETQFMPPKLVRSINVARGTQLGVVSRHIVAYGHTMAFRREVGRIATPFPDSWGFDHWLAVMGVAAGRIKYLAEPLSRYRHHGSQAFGASAKSLGAWARDASGTPASSASADVEKWGALLDRIDAQQSALSDYDGARRAAAEKVDFLRFRASVRGAKPLKRFLSATIQLVRGRYHRLGRGFLAYGRDVYGAR